MVTLILDLVVGLFLVSPLDGFARKRFVCDESGLISKAKSIEDSSCELFGRWIENLPPLWRQYFLPDLLLTRPGTQQPPICFAANDLKTVRLLGHSDKIMSLRCAHTARESRRTLSSRLRLRPFSRPRVDRVKK